MMKFKVSFKYSEYVYCTNIAIAENIQDVEKHYSDREWYNIEEATDGDIKEAERKGMPIVTIEHIEEEKENKAMTNNNYLKETIENVKEYIEYNMDLENDILTGEFEDRDAIEEYLNDTLWTADEVTGNASGSYTFNREEAKEKVLADIDTVREALHEFGTDAGTIAERFLDEDWEYFDVTARCYILGQAIAEALDEIEEDIEKAIEARENEVEEA